MSFNSLCLCPVGLAAKLNIDISKTVYWIRLRVGDEWHLFNSSLLFVSTVWHSKTLSRRPLKVVLFILHFSKECFLLLVFNSKSCCIDLVVKLLVAGLFVLCFYPFVNKNSKWLYGRKEIGTRRLSPNLFQPKTSHLLQSFPWNREHQRKFPHGMSIASRPIRCEMKPQKITDKEQQGSVTTWYETTSWSFLQREIFNFASEHPCISLKKLYFTTNEH